MKKISMLLVTIAMVLTMTQCKKNEATDQNKTVTITLDVKHDNSAKVDVDPTIGTVDFETGDKVYVSSGGKYVGFLTHNGTNFVGNITNPTENQPLQFYFLGNVTPQEILSAGTTEECSVIISDQTEHLPVISCAASNENYVSGLTSYTGHLLNKCALVKFNVTTPSNSPICITGMKNKVTVDFSQNTMTPSIDGEGVIKLPAGAGENVEKWAILLPQEAMDEGEEGSAYSEDGSYTGIRPTISMILENDYMANGITVMVNTVPVAGIPEGAINGLFTINANGDQVYFSQGNLQYIGSAATPYWKFADNQWDYFGDNGQGSEDQDVDRDLFGWGTSGYHDSSDPYNVNYQPWSTSMTIVDMTNNYQGYGPSVNMPSSNLTGTSANYDWGVYNLIANGGNQENLWRTLTYPEWFYIFNSRNTLSESRYVKANINGVNGVILLPDNWNSNVFDLENINSKEASFTSNNLTTAQWVVLEQCGVVFLPAAGGRNRITLHDIDSQGCYWSASTANSANAARLFFYDSDLNPLSTFGRCGGQSVRLVKDYNP